MWKDKQQHYGPPHDTARVSFLEQIVPTVQCTAMVIVSNGIYWTGPLYVPYRGLSGHTVRQTSPQTQTASSALGLVMYGARSL